MEALTVANYIVAHYGDTLFLTNLKLNKLVYFAQIFSLQIREEPLFTDDIEAHQFGPAIPAVYNAYSVLDGKRILRPVDYSELPQAQADIVEQVIARYGCLNAFELDSIARSPRGSWASVYHARTDDDNDGRPKIITTDDIQRHEGAVCAGVPTPQSAYDRNSPYSDWEYYL